MTIATRPTKLHWNYFLALERDMESVSRYIEFCTPNMSVYSIELAHLLFAAASEVDVIAKLICKQVSPNVRCRDINDYRSILCRAHPDIATTEVFVPRFELTFRPWDAWTGKQNPIWWRAYNRVKHERDAHYGEATLKNSLNALGALLIFTYHYYRRQLAMGKPRMLSPKETTHLLEPSSVLLRLSDDHYHSIRITC